MAQPLEQSSGRVTKVVVATSIMLTFISSWRAAAIVLNDLGSSAFYVGGIAEQAIGRAAPWFILGVMLSEAHESGTRQHRHFRLLPLVYLAGVVLRLRHYP
jgi:hypothetical protein